METFDTIFGQDQAIDWLRQTFLADRLPHGLIFAGPVGVGKATTARALAALFLCENPQGACPCGQCPGCTIMAAGNHPDYHVITKELIRYHDKTGKSKGIDLSLHVIRPELIDPANRKATMNRGKVFVIEQAELMNAQAQNGMLKTLEEPAGRTLIVLLTDQPGLLLPTIRSRCQTVRFAALETTRVRSELQKRGIEPALAEDAARFAEGSLGLALKWIEDGVIENARAISDQMGELLSGRMPPNLPEWFKNAAEAYADKQLERDELSSKDQAMREGLSLYLRIAAGVFRDRLHEGFDNDANEALCGAIDVLTRAEQYLDANVSIPLVFQQLTVALQEQFNAVEP